MGLTGVSRRKVAKYSLGMRRRLDIAIALLAAPPLIVLDKPMNGLAPVGTRDTGRTLRSLATGGATVLVPSHQFGEIAQPGDQASVLISGRAAYQGNLAGVASNGDLEAGFFRFLEETGATVADAHMPYMTRKASISYVDHCGP